MKTQSEDQLLSERPRVRIAPGTPPPRKHCVFGGIHFSYSVVSVPVVQNHSLYDDVAYTSMYTVPMGVKARFDYILTTLGPNSHLKALSIKAFAAHYFARLYACQAHEWPVLLCIS